MNWYLVAVLVISVLLNLIQFWTVRQSRAEAAHWYQIHIQSMTGWARDYELLKHSGRYNLLSDRKMHEMPVA